MPRHAPPPTPTDPTSRTSPAGDVRAFVASALAPLAEPDALFEHLLEHMEEGDVDHERLSPVSARISQGTSRLSMERREDGLRFDIEAGDAIELQLWREGVVAHVAEHAPEAARDMRWSDGLAPEGTVPPHFRVASVLASGEVMPGLRRVELALDVPLGSDGIHVGLLIPPAGRTPVWPVLEANGAPRVSAGADTLHARTYTIRSASADGARLTFDIVDHPGGRVAEWAAGVRAGDEVGVLGPGGGNEMTAAGGELVVAGDMTALPAMARLLDSVPDARVRAWAACPSQRDADAYFGTGRVTAIEPAAFDARIVDVLRAESAPDRAWFAGELETAKTVRRLFGRDWGLDPRRRLAVGYWQRHPAPAGEW